MPFPYAFLRWCVLLLKYGVGILGAISLFLASPHTIILYGVFLCEVSCLRFAVSLCVVSAFAFLYFAFTFFAVFFAYLATAWTPLLLRHSCFRMTFIVVLLLFFVLLGFIVCV